MESSPEYLTLLRERFALHLSKSEPTNKPKLENISMNLRIMKLTPAEDTADGADEIEPDADTLESFGCCIVKDGCLKIFPVVVPSNSSLKS